MKIDVKIHSKTPVSHPVNDEITVSVSMSKKMYSDPKLFIPKINGKPTVGPKKIWYVSFYWRDPKTGVLNKKFTFTKGINRLKTVKERKAAGQALANAYKIALDRGWNPITNTTKAKRNSKIFTLKEALHRALEIKKKSVRQSTFNDYEFNMNRFIAYCDNTNTSHLSLKDYTIDHFYKFFDYLRFEHLKDDGNSLSGTSVNNAKRTLSSLFTVLKNERYIHTNFLKDIPNVDQEPVNNKAFTYQEFNTIREYVTTNDPYLWHFISFIIYPILRPSEICRLKVSDINTEEWYLKVQTKTSVLSYKRIIKKLKPTLEILLEEKQPASFHLFTNKGKPANWSTENLKSKVDHFGRRFKKVKKSLGFGREYGLYSFRHTAIMDLYLSLRSKKVAEREIIHIIMPITGHTTESGLRNYLRKLEQIMPEDHSELYSSNF